MEKLTLRNKELLELVYCSSFMTRDEKLEYFIVGIEDNFITTMTLTNKTYSEFKLFDHNIKKMGSIMLNNEELHMTLLRKFKDNETIEVMVSDDKLIVKSKDKEIAFNGRNIKDRLIMKPIILYHHDEKFGITTNRYDVLDKMYRFIGRSNEKGYCYITVPLRIRPSKLRNIYFDIKSMIECIEKLPDKVIEISVLTYYDESDNSGLPIMNAVIDLNSNDIKRFGRYLLWPEIKTAHGEIMDNSIELMKLIR